MANDSNDTTRWPLAWPVGQPRTPESRRENAAFKVDFRRARDETIHSLTLLGARNVILSSNVPLRLDGLPYANVAEPHDPGVAAYFDRRDSTGLRPFVIACDSYAKVRWNLRAIGATVDALRSIQRHGATSMLEQAFAGFAALPPAGREPPWWEVLGVPRDATNDAVSECGRYRYALERRIPDVVGPNLCWLMLNPSTADATQDDPTIRKVIGFTRRAGYGVALVVNLFALRATKPRDLRAQFADAEGEHNCAAIMEAAMISDAVVCAWGAHPWAREQANRVLGWLAEHPREKPIRLLCLGTTKDGDPLHPLMPSYDGHPLVPFTPQHGSIR